MGLLAKSLATLCAFGCSFQLISLGVKYFSYSVTYETKLADPVELDLPDVSMCFYLTYIIDFSELLKKYPDFDSGYCDSNNNWTQRINCIVKESRKTNYAILGTLRAYELHNYIIKPEVLFPQISVSGMHNHSCTIEPHTMWQHMCYHISCAGSVTESRRNGGSLINPTLITIYLNRTLLNTDQAIRGHISILPHDFRHRLISGDSSVALILPELIHDEQNVFLIKYYRTFITLLPSPYPSKCQYYTKWRLLDDCLQSLSIKKFGSIFTGAYIDGKLYSKLNVSLLSKENESMDSIIDICAAKYSAIECNTVEYKTIADNQYAYPDKNNGTIVIIVRRPEKFDTIINERETMSSQQFSVMFLSLLSSWFGISIFQCAVTLAYYIFSFDLKGYFRTIHPINHSI